MKQNRSGLTRPEHLLADEKAKKASENGARGFRVLAGNLAEARRKQHRQHEQETHRINEPFNHEITSRHVCECLKKSSNAPLRRLLRLTRRLSTAPFGTSVSKYQKDGDNPWTRKENLHRADYRSGQSASELDGTRAKPNWPESRLKNSKECSSRFSPK